MEERVGFRVGGLSVSIVRGVYPPVFKGPHMRMGDVLLEMDAGYSVFGDTLAGILLPPLEPIGGDTAWLGRVVSRYRARVVAEEYLNIITRLGSMAEEVKVDPAYPPASRMHQLSRLYSCIYNRALEGVEDLRREYRAVREDLGIGEVPSRSRARVTEVLKSYIMSITIPLNITAARIISSPPEEVSGCSPEGLLKAPWKLLSLPEGGASIDCKSIDEVLKELVGAGYKCTQPNPISSSVKCSGEGRSVILKEYTRMYAKWIPAAIAASTTYGYRLSPKERLAADYRYLRLMRRVTVTPRIIHVCSDNYTAKMLREYMEGTPLVDSRDPEEWARAGEVLARIHTAGYTLGDTNPGNLLVTPGGGIAVIDAEQAKEATLRGMAWDIIVATVTSIFYGVPEDLIEALLSEYRKTHAGALQEALRDKYWMSLLIIPHIIQKARNLIKRVAEGPGAGYF
ncbi:MAG: hypothetical protein GSR86_06855 [Desulfurococcales archaeon]|nr:hypothetical protein [Desulfurococcales archaeon]